MSGSAPQVIVNSENVCYLLNIYAFIFLFVGVVLVRMGWCGVREAAKSCASVCGCLFAYDGSHKILKAKYPQNPWTSM